MMSKTNTDAYLFCLNCDKDTDHKIEYRDGQIHRITCAECGMAIQINQEYIQAHFKEDFVTRVMSKPGRMTKEMQADLNGFIKSLPYRVITKPYRVYKEWEQEEKKK
ncbi:bh protein [Eubacterium aggregans]|uniref:bh protein n=1 Tax=Eubacterium aggregans TaxID=81409 RepID=UPI003F2D6D96